MEAADVEAADVEAADVEAADVEAARGNAQRDICFGRLWACILPAYIHINIYIICGVHCQCPLVPLAVHFVWGPKKCPLIQIIIVRPCMIWWWVAQRPLALSIDVATIFVTFA